MTATAALNFPTVLARTEYIVKDLAKARVSRKMRCRVLAQCPEFRAASMVL